MTTTETLDKLNRITQEALFCDGRELNGWTLHWTGWKAAQDTLRLESQLVATLGDNLLVGMGVPCFGPFRASPMTTYQAGSGMTALDLIDPVQGTAKSIKLVAEALGRMTAYLMQQYKPARLSNFL